MTALRALRELASWSAAANRNCRDMRGAARRALRLRTAERLRGGGAWRETELSRVCIKVASRHSSPSPSLVLPLFSLCPRNCAAGRAGVWAPRGGQSPLAVPFAGRQRGADRAAQAGDVRACQSRTRVFPAALCAGGSTLPPSAHTVAEESQTSSGVCTIRMALRSSRHAPPLTIRQIRGAMGATSLASRDGDCSLSQTEASGGLAFVNPAARSLSAARCAGPKAYALYSRPASSSTFASRCCHSSAGAHQDDFSAEQLIRDLCWSSSSSSSDGVGSDAVGSVSLLFLISASLASALQSAVAISRSPRDALTEPTAD